ncbi:MAG: peptidase [Alphaproteobacteria bacterium]|nr:peptidase [Alphaproteobacteria bacterium]MDB5720788.1 peptidase [Alphaproteobacteria bacterium]
MTYCIGLLLDLGLVMIADTRTNAGVDNFSSHRKLHTLANGPERQIFACTSGSLSMSQNVLDLLDEGLPIAEDDGIKRTIATAPSMFRVVQLIGEAVQDVNRTVGKALAESDLSSSVSFLVGGRIGGERPHLYQIYSAGNYIECSPESPFLQIGETKYGKPILDRGIRAGMPLSEAVKVGFLSFDSAMRSNLGVARPLDLLVMPTDREAPLLTRRIEADDEYFNLLSLRWSELLHEATELIPNPPFMRIEGERAIRAVEKG